MNRFLHFAVLLMIMSFVMAAAPVASVQPDKPKIGDVVTLTYDPKAAGAVHTDTPDLYAVILFIHMDDAPTMLEQKMERSGDRWITSFTITDSSAVIVAVRYDSGEKIDDNNAHVQNVILYGKNGKPLEGAYGMLGSLHLSRNYYGFKFGIDTLGATKALQQEFTYYPLNWRAKIVSWRIALKNTNTEKMKKQIAKELSTVYTKHKKNQKAVRDLLPTFTMTDQSAMAEKIESEWIAKDPNGLIAEAKAQQEFMKEQDQTKRAERASAFLERFTVQKGLEPMFLSALLRVKDYDGALSFIEKYPDVSPNYYNSIGYALIKKGENIDKGIAITKKGLDRIAIGDVRTTLDFLPQTRKSWKDNISYLKGMIGDTYGEGLMIVGRYPEAEAVLEESNVLMESDDPDNNARLVECYVKNGKNDKAVSLSYAALVKGKGNPQLIELYKTAYTSVNGSPAGFDSVVTAAKSEMKKEMIAKLKKEKIDLPSVDFDLKSLDGSRVKLSDLKGKVVVLDFWATWCGPCLSSFPSLQKIYDRYKDNPDVKILAMNTWERVAPEKREQHVKDFMTKNNYTFPVVFDTDLVSQYGVEGIPTKFFIDKNGRISFKDVGFGGAQEMEDKMELQFDMLLHGDVSSAK